ADLVFGAAGTFEVVGNMNSSGGSCLILPPADTHLVRGSLIGTGGVSLGSGLWVFDGAVNFASGGTVPCFGRNVALEALDATIVVNGNPVHGGSCVGVSFCLGAGFQGAQISAPLAGDLAGISVIGPTDATAGNALINAGAEGTSVAGV